MNKIIKHVFGRFYWHQHSAHLDYKGSWKNGSFHGKGQLKSSNGTLFKGVFKSGSKTGFGKVRSPSDYQYAGDWISGKKTGYGKINYKNGDIYKGQVLDGLRHGLGELHIATSGWKFKGVWTNEQITGAVEITTTDWTFKGKMTEIHAPMVGQMSYADKSVYVGELLDFSRQGQGTLTKHSGECIAGVWSDNVNVEDATRTDSQGIFWKGSLRNLKPEGFMQVRLPNGQEYDGVWESGDMMRVLSVYNREREPKPYVIH